MSWKIAPLPRLVSRLRRLLTRVEGTVCARHWSFSKGVGIRRRFTAVPREVRRCRSRSFGRGGPGKVEAGRRGERMDMRAGRAHTGYQRYLFDGKSRFKEATGTF